MAIPLYIAHRSSALLIGIFAIAHIANHLALFAGAERHIALMDSLRSIYRLPAIELVLLGAVGFQVFSGLRLALHQWRARRGFILWLQAGSGFLLAVFLLVHVSAVLGTRAFTELDTNLWFAAAGIHSASFRYFFLPYYFLAVAGLFTHVGCALYWRANRRSMLLRKCILIGMISIGVLCSASILIAMNHKISAVDFPPHYLSRFGA